VDYAKTSIMGAMVVKKRTYPDINVLFSIAPRKKMSAIVSSAKSFHAD